MHIFGKYNHKYLIPIMMILIGLCVLFPLLSLFEIIETNDVMNLSFLLYFIFMLLLFIFSIINMNRIENKGFLSIYLSEHSFRRILISVHIIGISFFSIMIFIYLLRLL
ncbi:hypothetical protein B6U90_05395 [Thermoplasmatales archaeon ex4484_6]|nr:MAG: hypothetical protein B6U90_05395 [Thermoplasmatales archaeon ex4484_6]